MHVVDLTISAAQVSSDRTDYPVYVDLADMNASFWSTVTAGGGDIRVFKSDGVTELPRDVVSCETGSSTGELHFKYTGTLSSSVDTTVQIHVDGVSADYAFTDPYGRNNVWSNYTAIFHLEEGVAGTGTSGAYKNSTGGNDGTDQVSATGQTGKLGAGQQFDGTDDYISVTHSTDFNPNGGSFTVSVWAGVDSATYSTDNRGMLTKGNISTAAGRWLLWAQGNSGLGTGIAFQYRNTAGINTIRPTVDQSALLSDGNLHLIVVSIDALGNADMYIDGTNVGSVATVFTLNINPTTQLEIGKYDTATIRHFDGPMDEIRISKNFHDVDSVLTQYNNQSSPSTFYSITTPIAHFYSLYGCGATPDLTLIQSSSKVNGYFLWAANADPTMMYRLFYTGTTGTANGVLSDYNETTAFNCPVHNLGVGDTDIQTALETLDAVPSIYSDSHSSSFFFSASTITDTGAANSFSNCRVGDILAFSHTNNKHLTVTVVNSANSIDVAESLISVTEVCRFVQLTDSI